MAKNKIQLFSALLINLNIIIGAGIFLNAKPLIQMAGSLSFLSYILGGLILLPLVLSLAYLAQANPVEGGLYAYSKKYIHPFAGFLSGWSYFVGKTISAAFLAHAFTMFFQKHIQFLQEIPSSLLTCITIFTLLILHIGGATIGGKIQIIFIITKIIPILTIILFGLCMYTLPPIEQIIPTQISLFSTIPIALYALMGFETTCSIGHMIQNAKKNIFRTIIGSFLLVVLITSLFQITSFFLFPSKFMANTPTITMFTTIFKPNIIVGKIITSFIFTSVIAGSFGIMTSNYWNLYSLAKNKHFPLGRFLIKKRKNIALYSLLLQGILACIMIIISKNQIALQSMSVFGVVFSFFITAFAALKASKKIKIYKIIPLLAIISCSYILFLCFKKIELSGISIPFIIVLGSGFIAALIQQKKLLFFHK